MSSSASLVTNNETIATGLGRLGSELDAEEQLVQTQIPAADAADAADDAGPPGEPQAELDFNELPPTTVSTVITKLRAPKCFRLRSRGELVCCWACDMAWADINKPTRLQ